MIGTYEIAVSGRVQGVGFRPFVWRLANQMQLAGKVWNHAQGVAIVLQADETQLHTFIHRLQQEAPVLAKITKVSHRSVADQVLDGFTIVATEQGEVATGCPPDAAICRACLYELTDPTNRRYRYPFINCTDCGPRLSIIQRIPYDREFTTMSVFQQCEACLREYHDPANRRFHAQPNACPQCGPNVWLENAQGDVLESADPFALLADALEKGKIVALKGLGGFHLACDATQALVVQRLRERKRRPHKAFALMVSSLAQLRTHAVVEDGVQHLLAQPEAPVVLLDQKLSTDIAANVAPGQYQMGFMLPYTPLHHLLTQAFTKPLVMTSGNGSGAPQAIDNDEARTQLAEIADLFLMHDRAIQNRLDDSVVRYQQGQVHYLRRARGYAPTSLPLPEGFSAETDWLALGAQMKNTVCLLKGGQAVISQYLGDLENVPTYDAFLQALALYQNLYQFKATHFVCDKHPDYLSSQYGDSLQAQGMIVERVQHHHAHLAACLGENGYPLNSPPVLGICMDGTGLGDDTTLWGGEWLLGNYTSYQRLAHITPFPLIGGSKAIIEPWRCLYAQLVQAHVDVPKDVLVQCYPPLASALCATFDKMLAQQLNTPLTSSAGRLFDAVAAALGCSTQQISYEGQAAIELETLARMADPDGAEAYPFAIVDNRLDPAPFWQALTADLHAGKRSRADMAWAFHAGFSAAVIALTLQLRKQAAFETVALSGGVLQNGLIFIALKTGLEAAGLRVLWHQQLPANDSAISLGQALVAAARFNAKL